MTTTTTTKRFEQLREVLQRNAISGGDVFITSISQFGGKTVVHYTTVSPGLISSLITTYRVAVVSGDYVENSIIVSQDSR